MKFNLKIKRMAIIIFEIICVLIVIALVRYTYSFFQVEAVNNSVITGEVASLYIDLTVTRIAPNSNKKLIHQ